MEFVRLGDGARLAYEVAGQGSVIVFAHCLGGSRAHWAPVIARLADRYRCIAYDLRGHGDSSSTPGPYTMAQLAQDALELLTACQVEKAVFAGISMGGMVGQELALLAPGRLSGLIVADSAAGFDATARAGWDERIALAGRDGLSPLIETMMGRWFSDAFRRDFPERVAPIAAILAKTDLSGYLACCAAVRNHDMTARLASIATPTLVVCGEHDPSTPLPLSQTLAAAIPGARLEVLPGLNHLGNLEAPEVFVRAVEPFLQALH